MDEESRRKKRRKKRHSKLCPCNEHIKVQTQYFSELVKKLSKLNETKRNKLFKSIDPCFIRFLGHCAQGILSSHIKLDKKAYKSLTPFKSSLLKLANTKLSTDKKRKELLKGQSGGFLGIIAGIVGAALAELVSTGVKKLIWRNK